MHIKNSIWIPLLIMVAAIIAFWYSALAIPVIWVFVPGAIVSFIVYTRTLYQNAHRSDQLLPLYLVALGIQFLHFSEEYCTGFVTETPILLDHDPYPLDYWILFNMVAYAVFVIGALALLKKSKSFMIIPLFFVVVGVLFNGIVHVMISIFLGRYFPGLYTALIYLIIGPLLVIKLAHVSKFTE